MLDMFFLQICTVSFPCDMVVGWIVDLLALFGVYAGIIFLQDFRKFGLRTFKMTVRPFEARTVSGWRREEH